MNAATGARCTLLLLCLSAILFAAANASRRMASAQDLDVTRQRVPLRRQIEWENVTDSAQVFARTDAEVLAALPQWKP